MTARAASLDGGPERRLPLEGARNFRDLGGYTTRDGRRVRWRTAFRSDALSELTEDDVRLLLDLRVTTVIDLRMTRELEESGRSPLHDHGVEHRHVPYIPEGGPAPEEQPLVDRETSTLTYLSGIEGGGAAVAAVFSALAEAAPGTSLVFHCSAGKDRTGITAALLLRTLGVPDATIIEDYVLTREFFTAWRDWSDEMLEERSRKRGYRISRALLDAAPETMRALLAGIDERYGSTERLLAEFGIEERLLAELRGRLLERPA